MSRVAIIGASMGGLIAAAALRERGIEVTLIERSKSIGGLYGTVSTPFGTQELGMHVLYAGNEQFRHLTNIFGGDAFNSLEGYEVDIGAAYNFGRLFLDSIYPDIRDHPSHRVIFDQVVKSSAAAAAPANAEHAVVQRFGTEAGRGIVAPILEKLWKKRATDLSPDSIHCFFDLRRIILCDKEMTDELKTDPRLDSVIGNPIQSRPRGQVFGGRRALFFKRTADPFHGKVEDWLRSRGVVLAFESRVTINEQQILVNGVPVNEFADGCIVATPVTNLVPDVQSNLDQLELTIFYVRLTTSIVGDVPAYYVMCHAPKLSSARIVNYDGYHSKEGGVHGILAVETLHPIGLAPTQECIVRELQTVLPTASIEEFYRLPKSPRIATPTLQNGKIIDSVIANLESAFKEETLFFVGMRTDRGIFFSHDTMGIAHDAAMECTRRLS